MVTLCAKLACYFVKLKRRLQTSNMEYLQPLLLNNNVCSVNTILQLVFQM